jgi:predicted acylesterase/phospholipase RssA
MRKLSITISLLAVVLLTAGCGTKKYTAPKEKFYKRVALNDPKLQKKDLKRTFSHEPWTKKRADLPQLGIALSGGGSRSAPFALGVLKRIVDAEALHHVDIISSVSGGSYAAYYLYTKELFFQHNAQIDHDLRDSFIDSRQKIWDEKSDAAFLFQHSDYNDLIGYNESHNTQTFCEEELEQKLTAASYQRRVRCYQDLLKKGAGNSTLNVPGLLSESATTLLSMLPYGISIPAHHLSNTLFDWKFETSLSQRRYKEGINRAYGYTPTQKGTGDYLYKDGYYSFGDLRRLIEGSKMPMWIINATNDVNFDSSPWGMFDLEQNRTIQDAQFELTPYGFGSNYLGYVKDETPDRLDIDVMDAVLASAAFFDSNMAPDYKLLGFLPKSTTFGLLHLINLRWGISRHNYNATPSTLHALLPWPLYYLDNFNTQTSQKIRLADGGMSGDNLGLYPLISRGTRHIIVVSGSFDGKPELKLEDLCSVDAQLEKEGFDLKFQGRPDEDINASLGYAYDIETICSHKEQPPHYRHWVQSIWRGVIEAKNAALKASPIEGIKLYVIKSAIVDESSHPQSIQKAFNSAHHNYHNNRQPCKDSQDGYPCTLIAWWGANTKYEAFPQHDTVSITLNSSSSLFSAYFDLGYYQSRDIDAVIKKVVQKNNNKD